MDLDAFTKRKAKGAKNAWEKERAKARTTKEKARELATHVVHPTTCRTSARKEKARVEKRKAKRK
eukprot:1014088-Amphidinium_carterae.1